MRLVFIDEVEQHQKKPGFFGVGSLVVDSVHYSALRKGVESALSEASWDPTAEFKGRYIFSARRGDDTVGVERRIEIVRRIVATTTAERNARARFAFAYNAKGRTAANYLHLLGRALGRCPTPGDQRHDKPLISVYLDSLSDVTPHTVAEVIVPVLARRHMKVVEMPVLLPSSNSTAGLIAAGVLAYLKSWDVLSPRPTEAEQASLFETQAERLNATKLATIREILDLIKHVEVVS